MRIDDSVASFTGAVKFWVPLDSLTVERRAVSEMSDGCQRGQVQAARPALRPHAADTQIRNLAPRTAQTYHAGQHNIHCTVCTVKMKLSNCRLLSFMFVLDCYTVFFAHQNIFQSR